MTLTVLARVTDLCPLVEMPYIGESGEYGAQC